MLLFCQIIKDISRTPPKWNGENCPGSNISTESRDLYKFKGRSQNPKPQQFIHFIKLLCHGLFLLIISEWLLEPVVLMESMQCDMWKGTQDTYSHML